LRVPSFEFQFQDGDKACSHAEQDYELTAKG
jgi:hypothetical protein